MKKTPSVDALSQVFAQVLPHHEAYALHEPSFKGQEWFYVKECLDSGWVSSVGKFVNRFEADLAAFTGAKHAIIANNGTCALHMAAILAGVKAHDEVLVPSLTFVGTCNALHYCGAIPHFVDSDAATLGVDPVKLSAYLEDVAVIKNHICYNKNTARPIRALCVMHTFGHPVDLDALCDIADRYHLAMIEDAAEALGSHYKGQHVGYRGLIGALSFNGNKIITTGGGGAILTHDDALAKRAKHLTTTAKIDHPWLYEYDEVGYNYRLPNLNAALGCAQLEQLGEFLRVKRQLAQRYQKALAEFEGLSFLAEPSYAKSNYWLNAIVLDEAYSHLRDELLMGLNAKKYGVRPIWKLMHQLPMYADCPRMNLSVAESLARRVINIPSSAFLG